MSKSLRRTKNPTLFRGGSVNKLTDLQPVNPFCEFVIAHFNDLSLRHGYYIRNSFNETLAMNYGLMRRNDPPIVLNGLPRDVCIAMSNAISSESVAINDFIGQTVFTPVFVSGDDLFERVIRRFAFLSMPHTLVLRESTTKNFL